jgi:hypothetical protein
VVPLNRDPVSELWDEGARALLARAYKARGRWVSTRLEDPAPRHLVWAARRGINLLARDDASTRRRRGGLNAHTRWVRGFIRALYYQHQWWSDDGGGWRADPRLAARRDLAIQVRVGRAVPVRGVIPAGRHVEVRTRPGGKAALNAVKKLPAEQRIYDDGGARAGRASDLTLRDWDGE